MTLSDDRNVATSLAACARAIDRSISGGSLDVGARLISIILRRLPRHLPSYVRLLQICWKEQDWKTGEEWARRLLRADPGNAFAWRALARSAETEGRRAEANVIWQRAFEMSPYDASIRSGLSRTSLDPQIALEYNLACLAAMQLRGHRWNLAVDTYRRLAQADKRRVDFQVSLAVALWQSEQLEESYPLARHLVEHHPHLLMAWRTLAATGDEYDRALAESPVQTMDPDGEYAANVWGIGAQDHGATILLSPEEVAALPYRYPESRNELESDR